MVAAISTKIVIISKLFMNYLNCSSTSAKTVHIHILRNFCWNHLCWFCYIWTSTTASICFSRCFNWQLPIWHFGVDDDQYVLLVLIDCILAQLDELVLCNGCYDYVYNYTKITFLICPKYANKPNSIKLVHLI